MYMFTYSIQRVLSIIPLLFGTSLIIFTIFAITPFRPVSARVGFAPDCCNHEEYWREEWGLNDPFWERYLNWSVPILTKFDFGDSWFTGGSVIEEIVPYFDKTVLLFAGSMIVTVFISIILGMIGALKHNSKLDSLILSLSSITRSIPTFVMSMLTIILILWISNQNTIAIYDGSTQKSVYEYLHVIIAAGSVLSLSTTPKFVRIVRSTMLLVLKDNYLNLAVAKGLSNRTAISKHASPNMKLSITTSMIYALPYVFASMPVIEQVFNYPGIGRRMIRAALEYDIPIVLACCLIFSLFFIASFLLVDIIYLFVDPRIWIEKGKTSGDPGWEVIEISTS